MGDSDYRSRAHVGVYGGRSWHLLGRLGAIEHGRVLTVCGKRPDYSWRPGYRNPNPRTCPVCVRGASEAEGPTDAP